MEAILKGITSTELHEMFSDMGVTPHIARRIQGSVFRNGAFPQSLPEISPSLLNRIAPHCTVPELSLTGRFESCSDGFTRYLFAGEDGFHFESVRIPITNRPGKESYVVCVSSQIGCAQRCEFCATGKMGLTRNLAAWEIIDQVFQIKKDSAYPVRGVVFMGMGEPMCNLDAVLKAAEIMSEPSALAISAKNITISTSGIVPGIQKLISENRPYRLIISLSFSNSDQRRKFMPVERTYPLNDLIPAIRDYQLYTGDRVTLAWTMISGVNTDEKSAADLAELIGDIPVKIDLIDVNDSSGRFLPPGNTELNQFRDYLRIHLHAPISRRYSGGKDINAACGMLASGIE
jgi:23S rRNA (adenine2503-C2)-methyltransferase